MKFNNLEIPDVQIISPDIYRDDRGYFFESYNINAFKANGFEYQFRQDNESRSRKGVIRGLHFQKPPYEQGKLVRVVNGAVRDFAIDLRKGSPYYGKYCSAELSGDNKLMMWIPPGFAHGFIALEDDTVFCYKCTQVFDKESEMSIRWDDPDLNIDWGFTDPLVTIKDRQAPFLRDVESPFTF